MPPPTLFDPLLSAEDLAAREAILARASAFRPMIVRGVGNMQPIWRLALLHGLMVETQFFNKAIDNPHVLRFPEFNACDGGVMITKPKRQSGRPAPNAADKFFELDKNDLIVTIDVKGRAEHYTTLAKPFYSRALVPALKLDGRITYNPLQFALTQLYLIKPLRLPTMISALPSMYIRQAYKEMPTMVALSNCGTWLLPGLIPETPYWIGKLVDAIRQHATQRTPFVNPYTQVTFSAWVPVGVANPFVNAALVSTHSAEAEAMRIFWRALNRGALDSRVRFNLVSIAPLGADMVFEYKPQPDEPTADVPLQKLLVERKNGRSSCYLSAERRLMLATQRGAAEDSIRWFFDNRRLWHCILFTLEPNNQGAFDCFLIPQFEIPDEWYTTKDEWVEAPAEWLQKYRFRVDPRRMDHGVAIQRILDLVHSTSATFRRLPRPARDEPSAIAPVEEGARLDNIEAELVSDDEDEEDLGQVANQKRDPLHPEYTMMWQTTKGAGMLRLLNDECARQ